MSLAVTPRYDADRVPARGDHAVVLGGSMAGLLAARVLADAFDAVTLVEKGTLPDDPTPRPETPQARHVHVLQEAGRATLEDLFPGYSEALIAEGAPIIDIGRDLRFHDEGDFVARPSTRLPLYCGSRPLVEHLTRRRVVRLGGVTVRDDCQFVDYRLDNGSSVVEGVTVRNEADERETIRADLVVDATGRTSRTPRWLSRRGFSVPTVEEVEVDLAYSTVAIERPPRDRRGFLVMPSPPRRRGAAVFPVEGDRWLVTAFGLHGDHPPTDPDGLVRFVDSLPVGAVGNIIREHVVVSDGISHYRFPSSRRCHYWDLQRFPEGLVVVGDALASFNPIYGQGMSVAALEALHLHHAVADETLADLPLRFFQRTATVIADAWNLSVGSDFRFSETSGPKATGTDLLNHYLTRLTRRAHDDEVLAEAYARVVTMERRPSSLLSPRVAWRVLKPG